MADLAEAAGVVPPDFSPETQAVLDRHTRFSHAGNPIDVGVFGNFAAIDEIGLSVAADPDIGIVVAMLPPLAPGSRAELAAAYGAAQKATGTPHLILSPGGLDEAGRAAFAKHGLMTFTDTPGCVEAIAAFLADPADEAGEDRSLPAVPPKGKGALGEAESLALLAQAGVPVVEAVRCDDLAAAVAAADRIGYPVVMKGVVEGVAHKSDLGLVHLNLGDATAVRGAYEAQGGTVLVQPMLRGLLEAIVGVTVSPDVGPMLLAGLGGVHAEAMDDITLWSIPASRTAIERGLRASTLGRIVTGPRWRLPDAFGQIVDALMATQRLALTTERLIAIDVNPLLLTGRGAVAVDGLVMLDETDPQQRTATA